MTAINREIFRVEQPLAIWQGAPASWLEAEVIAKPVRAKQLTEPRVLVRRKQSQMFDRYGYELRVEKEFSAISLFTGAGGFDIGLEDAGYHTLCQVEWDSAACATLIANRPTYFRDSALIQGDIRQIPTSMILREAQLRVGETMLMVGGPPCQGFSLMNNNASKGKYDGRNDLVFEFLRVVREAQPQFFIFENVPNFQNFKGKINGKTYLETFLAEAHGSYYELVYGLINCVEYGVPQHRVRFICSGTRRDLHEVEGLMASLPAPEYFDDSDLRVIELYKNSLFPEQSEMITHPPGVRYFPDRPVLQTPIPTHGDGRTQKFIDFYMNLLKNEPDRIVRNKG
jgi:site-specific DNA-cytosine methylase